MINYQMKDLQFIGHQDGKNHIIDSWIKFRVQSRDFYFLKPRGLTIIT